MKKIEIQLETVTCPSCIKKIESALNKKEGVFDAKVLFHASKVKADFNGAIVSEKEIVDTIGKLGYQVISSSTY